MDVDVDADADAVRRVIIADDDDHDDNEVGDNDCVWQGTKPSASPLEPWDVS